MQDLAAAFARAQRGEFGTTMCLRRAIKFTELIQLTLLML